MIKKLNKLKILSHNPLFEYFVHNGASETYLERSKVPTRIAFLWKEIDFGWTIFEQIFPPESSPLALFPTCRWDNFSKFNGVETIGFKSYKPVNNKAALSKLTDITFDLSVRWITSGSF